MSKRLETRGQQSLAEVGHAQCRYCQTSFETPAEDSQHFCYGRVDTQFEDVTPAVLMPNVHEFTTRFAFANEGMSPYWAFVKQFDISEDKKEAFRGDVDTVEIDGEEWEVMTKQKVEEDDRFDEEKTGRDAVKVTRYWDGGIRAEGQDYDTFFEYQVALRAASEHHERKVTMQIKPSFPNMLFHDTGDPIKKVPSDLPEGVRVEVYSSNVHVDEILPIVQGFADAVDINPDYFDAERVAWGTIGQLGIYDRLYRAYGRMLVKEGGPIERIAHLSANVTGSTGEFKWDNEEVEGKYQAVAGNAAGWEQMLPGQQFGKRYKYYHPEHPRSVESDDDPMSSPKVEVQFSAKYNNGHVPWEKRHELLAELQETLLNVQHWANISIGMDAVDDVFRTDDPYFDVEPMDLEDIRIVDDPTPELKATEEDLAVRDLQAADAPLTEKRRQIIETVLRDGGMRYDDLAEKVDAHVATIYRTINDFGHVLDSQNGTVDFLDRVVRERVERLVTGLRDLGASAQTQASDLVDIRDAVEYEDSAFGKWVQAHGAKLAEIGRDGIEIDFTSVKRGFFTIRKLLRAGYISAVGGRLGGRAFLSADVRWVDQDGNEQRDAVDNIVRRNRLEDMLTWGERDDVAAIQ